MIGTDYDFMVHNYNRDFNMKKPFMSASLLPDADKTY